MVLQQIISIFDFAKTTEQMKGESLSSTGKVSPPPPVRPYQPPIFTLRWWHGPSYLSLSPDLRGF